MFYIAPVLGAEQTQKYFWKIFLEVIEGDPGSGVRKQCVRLVAILGSILGQEITERDLVSTQSQFSIQTPFTNHSTSPSSSVTNLCETVQNLRMDDPERVRVGATKDQRPLHKAVPGAGPHSSHGGVADGRQQVGAHSGG